MVLKQALKGQFKQAEFVVMRAVKQKGILFFREMKITAGFGYDFQLIKVGYLLSGPDLSVGGDNMYD